jgi:hypothetical protein
MELKTNTQDKRRWLRQSQKSQARGKVRRTAQFSYTVDYFTIGRDSVISFDDRADSEEVENLIEGLPREGSSTERTNRRVGNQRSD